MKEAEVEKPKRQRGRPFEDPETHNVARFSVSFPQGRYKELRREAQRQGLNICAFVRQTVLNRLDELAK